MIIAPGPVISGFMTAGHFAGFEQLRRGPRLEKLERSEIAPELESEARKGAPPVVIHDKLVLYAATAIVRVALEVSVRIPSVGPLVVFDVKNKPLESSPQIKEKVVSGVSTWSPRIW
jgi:hypothetical protein